MWALERALARIAPPSHGAPALAAREALGLCVGLVVLLGFSKPLLDGALGLTGAAYALAAAWQLFIPLDRLDRARIHPASFGIHVHGLVGVPLRILEHALVVRAAGKRASVKAVVRWFRPYTWRARLNVRGVLRELGLAALACAVTFPPFCLGFVELQRYLAARSNHSVVVDWQLPPELLSLLATHLLVVAVPEELFYRGYIHTLLVRAWPPRLTVFGASLGAAVLVGSFMFALGHFAGEWNPARLGPFFPALLFCALRSVGGGLLAAVIYHGLSNVVGEMVRVSVHWGP